MHSMTLLYVADQARSREFYSKLFDVSPVLDVESISEFIINDTMKMGILDERWMGELIGDALPSPKTGSGIPRVELYIFVDDPAAMYDKAISLGATSISAVSRRNWGHHVGYVADLDGHVLAFAKEG
jgi:uncharacterized glyoxalase superfamily protein PhnB